MTTGWTSDPASWLASLEAEPQGLSSVTERIRNWRSASQIPGSLSDTTLPSSGTPLRAVGGGTAAHGTFSSLRIWNVVAGMACTTSRSKGFSSMIRRSMNWMVTTWKINGRGSQTPRSTTLTNTKREKPIVNHTTLNHCTYIELQHDLPKGMNTIMPRQTVSREAHPTTSGPPTFHKSPRAIMPRVVVQLRATEGQFAPIIRTVVPLNNTHKYMPSLVRNIYTYHSIDISSKRM